MYCSTPQVVYLNIIIRNKVNTTLSIKMNGNPFYLRWNKDWSFTFFLEGGKSMIEAKGLGIIIIRDILFGESPWEAADRLIIKEHINRKSLYYSWKRSIKNN